MPKYTPILLLVCLLLTGCRALPSQVMDTLAPTPSPTIIPSPPLILEHTQPEMGFRLQLPSTWEGKYQENVPLRDPQSGHFDTVFLDYVPEKGQPYMIFEITRVNESEWLELNQDMGFLATELGRKDGKVYYAQISTSNPYPGSDAQHYQQFSLDVPRILETFTFVTPTASPLD